MPGVNQITSIGNVALVAPRVIVFSCHITHSSYCKATRRSGCQAQSGSRPPLCGARPAWMVARSVASCQILAYSAWTPVNAVSKMDAGDSTLRTPQVPDVGAMLPADRKPSSNTGQIHTQQLDKDGPASRGLKAKRPAHCCRRGRYLGTRTHCAVRQYNTGQPTQVDSQRAQSRT